MSANVAPRYVAPRMTHTFYRLVIAAPLVASCVVVTTPRGSGPPSSTPEPETSASTMVSATASGGDGATGTAPKGPASPANPANPGVSPASTAPPVTTGAVVAAPPVVLAATPVPDCALTLTSIPGYQKLKDYRCNCKASDSGQTLYGTGPFTADSSICRAARYAGIIKDAGVVTLTSSPGCPAYSGGTANGITASPWDAYAQSFHFAGSTGAACTACPRSFKDIPNYSKIDTYDCTCGAVTLTGALYGTGIYTTDSNICEAAKHTGAIKAGGGAVKLKRAPGCGAYKGSTANGVISTSWGAYNHSFFIVGSSPGQCQ